MASPITTSGFGVNVMPSTQLADPRLLTPQYSQILPSIGQGVGLTNNLLQIYQDAQDRPLRQALAQLNLEQQQLQNARLAQPVRQLMGSQIKEAPRFSQFGAINEDGTRSPVGYDLREDQIFEEYDPLTKQTRTVTAPGRVVKTMEDIANMDSLITARNAPDAARDNRTEAIKNIDALQEAIAAGDGVRANFLRREIEGSPRLTRADDIANTWTRIAQAEQEGNTDLAQSLRRLVEARTPSSYQSVGARAGYTPEMVKIMSEDPVGADLLARASAKYDIAGFFDPTPEDLEYIESVKQRIATPAARVNATVTPAMQSGNAPIRFTLPEVSVAPAGNAADAFLSATTAPAPRAIAQPTPAAIQYLRSNPSLAAQFDQKYGQGAAARILATRG